MLECKIWVLYFQNQVSYGNFLFIKVMQSINFAKFWNPEILLKFWDFWLSFCMWPLIILSNTCYIATWGQKWLPPWFLRVGGPPRPPHGSQRIRYPMGGRVDGHFWRRRTLQEWTVNISWYGNTNNNNNSRNKQSINKYLANWFGQYWTYILYYRVFGWPNISVVLITFMAQAAEESLVQKWRQPQIEEKVN